MICFKQIKTQGFLEKWTEMSEEEGSRPVVNWKWKVDDCKLILESLESFGCVYGGVEIEILVN